MNSQIYYHPYLYEAYYVDADDNVCHLAPMENEKPVRIHDVLPELDLATRGFILTNQVFESEDELDKFLYKKYEETFFTEDTV